MFRRIFTPALLVDLSFGLEVYYRYKHEKEEISSTKTGREIGKTIEIEWKFAKHVWVCESGSQFDLRYLTCLCRKQSALFSALSVDFLTFGTG